MLNISLPHATENATSRSDIIIQDADSAETDVPLDDAVMTDVHPPPSPNPESIDSQMHEPPERRVGIAFLCNPNDEDDNVRGHHTSELFNNEMDDVEKRALAEGCNSGWTFVMLIAHSNVLFS